MMIAKDLIDISIEDKTIQFFEGQYYVNGMIYRSCILAKTAIFDTVDAKCIDEWFEKLNKELEGKAPTYLIISHVEPDHSSGIAKLLNSYPEVKVVATAIAFDFITRFYCISPSNKVIVKDGDILQIDKHTLHFITAPMVHWPEVLMTFDETTGVLFSADAFGTFGTDTTLEWANQARLYYINIVGKYGAQVQSVMKKLPSTIKTICPLHGRIINENIGECIRLYDIWSSYRAEEEGVLVVYSSIYGNTEKAAKIVYEALIAANINSKLIRLTDESEAEAIANAFRFSRLVLCSTTYNAGLFPLAVRFLQGIKNKGYRSRKVAIVENGSWAPIAAKIMKEELSQMKDIDVVASVSILSSVHGKESQLKELAEIIAKV